MTRNQLFMSFPGPQHKVTFLNRPQRFLAEVAFPDGTRDLSYCANPGTLRGCLQSGSTALIWDSQDLKRKRRYTWRAIKLGDVWIGTDTHLANRLVEQALERRLFPGLKSYKVLEKEKMIGKGLRIDFLLTGKRGICFLEVKSATIVENGVAQFPDSITPRSLKHVKALTQKARQGHRAILVFVIQRGDAKAFRLNSSHYPAYATAFEKALVAGVEIFALALRVTPKGFVRPKLLPCFAHVP